MVKLKTPLLSLGARGRLTRAITFLRRRKQAMAEKTPVIKDAKSLAQLSWRHMYQKAVALWHALSAAEKEEWESLARPRHMTGFAWFMSQCLRPNPGIYLPLQGGTMQGAIDMDGYHIHGLPAPIHLQDPLRRQDYVDYIQPFLHAHGARVWKDANFSVPNNTWTILPFNREYYDTDVIHDNAVSNSRLTCKTAGKYVIVANITWDGHTTGFRRLAFWKNGAVWLNSMGLNIVDLVDIDQEAVTIYDLAVDEYVECRVLQNSGGALNSLYNAQRTPSFMMQRIGT